MILRLLAATPLQCYCIQVTINTAVSDRSARIAYAGTRRPEAPCHPFLHRYTLGCQMKSFVQNTRAHQCHQDLVVCDARPLIHSFQIVQEIHDPPLIEERNRAQSRS